MDFIQRFLKEEKLAEREGFATALALRCKLALANRFAPEPLPGSFFVDTKKRQSF